MDEKKKKVALIHRYGLEGWLCCGGHAIPGVIDKLSEHAEVHFYGPRSSEPENPTLREKVIVHELPYLWNRSNPGDKITKTIPWYFCLPWIGLRCRLSGINALWNDETVPLTALILRVFYGKNIAITVMDFFARIYTDKKPYLYWLRDLIEWTDSQSWKMLPLFFTHVDFAKKFLTDRGISADKVHVVPNPCDHSKFHPVDEATRKATREKFGYTDNDLVISHHGILHPNKGNDWILQRLAEVKASLPQVKYLLMGNGPEMAKLQQLASELDLTDCVTFAGWLPSEKDLNAALASADIGLVMRIGQETDHFHMTDTLNHEMACGKPVLAVHLEGIAEIIKDGENGFLFQPDQPEAFCERLQKLAANPQLRSDFGQKTLHISKTISDIEVCAGQLATPLIKLIS